MGTLSAPFGAGVEQMQVTSDDVPVAIPVITNDPS